MLRAGLATTVAMLTAGCANLEQPTGENHRPEIQVVGSATIEKAPEVFTVQAKIVEHAKNRVDALAAASAKLDRITAGVGRLAGLASYTIKSDEASAVVTRPEGCDVGRYGYSGVQRPRDCSPIDAVATIQLGVAGAPAEKAGTVISFLTQAGVESASLTGFDVKDRDAAEREAKQAALADAEKTAQALAEQAKVRITRPTTIRYGDVERFQQRSFELPPEPPNAPTLLLPPPPPPAEPTVSLALAPTSVRLSAEVAVTFAIAGGEAP
jgi:uncharacterized protein YggE